MASIAALRSHDLTLVRRRSARRWTPLLTYSPRVAALDPPVEVPADTWQGPFFFTRQLPALFTEHVPVLVSHFLSILATQP
jgi:hypothetical protein